MPVGVNAVCGRNLVGVLPLAEYNLFIQSANIHWLFCIYYPMSEAVIIKNEWANEQRSVEGEIRVFAEMVNQDLGQNSNDRWYSSCQLSVN